MQNYIETQTLFDNREKSNQFQIKPIKRTGPFSKNFRFTGEG